MKECLNEEILQQYFDRELVGERMESAALHLAGCEACAALLGELESETNLLSSALAAEFGVAVPTERLHRRIEAAIAGLHVASPARSQAATSGWHDWVETLSAMVSLSPQRAFAYAGLVAVLAFAVVFGVVTRRGPNPIPQAKDVTTTDVTIAATNSGPPTVASARISTESPLTVNTAFPSKTPSGPKALKPNRKVVPGSDTSTVPAVKLLPGERSYLKTIAALDSTIKSGNKAMRPALQTEYERNLALVDRAIAATRSAAKRNPNDPDAADFMFAAYQSKVDLLNTIADARVYNRPR